MNRPSSRRGDDVVCLNVGGREFYCSRFTLTTAKNSYFDARFASDFHPGGQLHRDDEDGCDDERFDFRCSEPALPSSTTATSRCCNCVALHRSRSRSRNRRSTVPTYFIDRNPKYFSYILQFLRDQQTELPAELLPYTPDKEQLWECLSKEADFYCLTRFQELLHYAKLQHTTTNFPLRSDGKGILYHLGAASNNTSPSSSHGYVNPYQRGIVHVHRSTDPGQAEARHWSEQDLVSGTDKARANFVAYRPMHCKLRPKPTPSKRPHSTDLVETPRRQRRRMNDDGDDVNNNNNNRRIELDHAAQHVVEDVVEHRNVVIEAVVHDEDDDDRNEDAVAIENNIVQNDIPVDVPAEPEDNQPQIEAVAEVGQPQGNNDYEGIDEEEPATENRGYEIVVPYSADVFSCCLYDGRITDQGMQQFYVTLELPQGVAVRPSHYSLRHSGINCPCGMESWDFLASKDGHTWVRLHEARRTSPINMDAVKESIEGPSSGLMELLDSTAVTDDELNLFAQDLLERTRQTFAIDNSKFRPALQQEDEPEDETQDSNSLHANNPTKVKIGQICQSIGNSSNRDGGVYTADNETDVFHESMQGFYRFFRIASIPRESVPRDIAPCMHGAGLELYGDLRTTSGGNFDCDVRLR